VRSATYGNPAADGAKTALALCRPGGGGRHGGWAWHLPTHYSCTAGSLNTLFCINWRIFHFHQNSVIGNSARQRERRHDRTRQRGNARRARHHASPCAPGHEAGKQAFGQPRQTRSGAEVSSSVYLRTRQAAANSAAPPRSNNSAARQPQTGAHLNESSISTTFLLGHLHSSAKSAKNEQHRKISISRCLARITRALAGAHQCSARHIFIALRRSIIAAAWRAANHGGG